MKGQHKKYTRFCNAQTLIAAIQAHKKDQQTMHVLLSVFKKPLRAVEDKFRREGLFDAINRITVRQGPIEQPLAWIFVISGSFTYFQMPFQLSQFLMFSDWTNNAVRYDTEGVYAVLTQEDYRQLINLQQGRQLEAIKKFIKSNVFYPYYLEENHAQEFVSLMRIKKLGYNNRLNWKDEDGSHKIGVVFKGILSLEYVWKRKLEIAQLTRGMYITNHYIKDQIEQIEDFELEPIEPRKKMQQKLPRYSYLSKADETVILIFNVRLIREEPYNVNPDLLPLLKEKYEKYESILERNIKVDQEHKLHRNKSSIKEEIKRKEVRDTFRRNVSLSLSKTGSITSPVLRTFHTIQLESSPLETARTIDIPQPVKSYSKTVFTAISPVKNNHNRSYSSEGPKSLSSRRLIHNTWIEQMSKKKPNAKSFSTLQSLTTYHPHRHQKKEEFFNEIQKKQKPAFFVPDQFVKKKLRMKYENLISKVRNMDLSIGKSDQDNVTGRMQRLEDYIESKRIVKINNAKRKFKLLRDKVQY